MKQARFVARSSRQIEELIVTSGIGLERFPYVANISVGTYHRVRLDLPVIRSTAYKVAKALKFEVDDLFKEVY